MISITLFIVLTFVTVSDGRDISLFSVLFPEDLNVVPLSSKNDHLDSVATDVMNLRSAMLGLKGLPGNGNMKYDNDHLPLQREVSRRVNSGIPKAKQGVSGKIAVKQQMRRMQIVTGTLNVQQKKRKQLGGMSVDYEQNLQKHSNRIDSFSNQKMGYQPKKRILKDIASGIDATSGSAYESPMNAIRNTSGNDFNQEVVDSEFTSSEIVHEEEQILKPSFDFIVGGFPKCGTTTLLKAFAAHSETDMAASEQCSIASPGQADFVVLRKLDETLDGMSSDPSIKRSFKCPTAMYSYKSIVRMEKHSPNAKFIVGVRHPIKMLQSFYNYRVTEIYERNLYGKEVIPSFVDLMESGLPWKGVSPASVRFDLFLMQLGKTRVTSDDMKELARQHYELAIKPSNFTVFLYSVDQLEDDNKERSEILRAELQRYLGLASPIEAFGHENKNHAVGTTGHKESINICDNAHSLTRHQVLEYSSKTAEWLRDHFIQSPDVYVANKEHFIETLESWSVDPCEGMVAENF